MINNSSLPRGCWCKRPQHQQPSRLVVDTAGAPQRNETKMSCQTPCYRQDGTLPSKIRECWRHLMVVWRAARDRLRSLVKKCSVVSYHMVFDPTTFRCVRNPPSFQITAASIHTQWVGARSVLGYWLLYLNYGTILHPLQQLVQAKRRHLRCTYTTRKISHLPCYFPIILLRLSNSRTAPASCRIIDTAILFLFENFCLTSL